MKIKSLIVAVAALLATTSAFAQVSVNEVGKMFNEANEKYKAKNYAEAVELFNKTIEAAYEADAMEIAEKAQKFIPNCYYNMGNAAGRNGEVEKALELFAQADEIAKLYNDAATSRKAKAKISGLYKKLGADAFNNGDYASAAATFVKGYEANPQDTDLALYLAMSYCEMKDFENGVKVYTDIIALENRHSKFAEPAARAKAELSNYLLVKAQDENNAGDKEAAYATLETLIGADPMNGANQMFRLQMAGGHQDWAKILEWGDLAAAIMATPEEQSEVYYLMAVAHDSQNNNQQAVDTYKMVTAGDKLEPAKKRAAELEAFIKAEKEAK